MKLHLLVALFGAAGSALRYSFHLITPRYFYLKFSLNKILVNLFGSFFVAAFISLFDKGVIIGNIKIYVIISLLGWFTTFSSFSIDFFNPSNKSPYMKMISYILFSFFGVLLIFTVYKITSIF